LTGELPYYFIIRENDDIILKAKNVGFCCVSVLEVELEEYLMHIEMYNSTPEESVYPENRIGIYNQSEQNRIGLCLLS